MGLSSAQARFLGITSRRAACEFETAKLAQQKMELSNQLSAIATDYANAMNGKKLVWASDVVDGQYNLTYGLLMSPSALNDYNPYLLTSTTGAVILTSAFAQAAKAAGIDMSGGVPSADGRQKFIEALQGSNIITQMTKAEINDETWNPAAGMGAAPLLSNSVDGMTMYDMVFSEDYGQQKINWYKLIDRAPDMSIDKTTYNSEKERLESASKNYRTGEDEEYYTYPNDEGTDNLVYKKACYVAFTKLYPTEPVSDNENDKQNLSIEKYNNELKWIADAKNGTIGSDYDTSYFGTNPDANSQTFKYQLAAYEDALTNKYNEYYAKGVNSIPDEIKQTGEKLGDEYTIVQNGVINNETDFSKLTVADLITGNITLMLKNSSVEGSNKASAGAEKISNDTQNLMNSIFQEIFGWNNSGHGLNIDDNANEALNFAYNMVRVNILRPGNAVKINSGTSNSDTNKNDAYLNAQDYNRIGQDKKGTYSAINLSRVIAAFLTYYEQYLGSSNLPLAVNKAATESTFITQSTGYKFVGKNSEQEVEDSKKYANFYDQLYNNLCEHGWRLDDNLNDNSYLETLIKNGTYSLTCVHDDGFYYQTTYSRCDYVTEVTDSDAIAKAEAEYTRKKAEITYKENAIDVRTKTLDAELAALNTEMQSVQGLLQNNINKAFTMFQGS